MQVSSDCQTIINYDNKGRGYYKYLKCDDGKILTSLMYKDCVKLVAFQDQRQLDAYINTYLTHHECPEIPEEFTLLNSCQ